MENYPFAEREITFHLKPDDLLPDQEQIASWQTRIAGQGEIGAYFALGALMSAVEGIAGGMRDADGRYVSQQVRIGLTIIAAYNAVTEERRQALRDP
jgi:hypothetical protein